MITRNIIEKILPKALPLAIGFSIVYLPVYPGFQAMAADNVDNARISIESASDIASAPVRSTSRKAPKAKASKAAEIEDPIYMPPDESPSEASPTDSRVKELVYNESNVYVVRAKFGYQTNIVFDPKEEVQTISIGDRSLWQVIPAGNRLFIRPMTENISTNMTLITNKRSYEFDLKSVSENNDSNVYVLKFTYPEKISPIPTDNFADAQYQQTNATAIIPPVSQKETLPQKPDSISSITPSPEAATPESIGLLPIRFNYSYTYSGPDAIAPTQVYDDGKNTFIKYKSIGKVVPEAFIIESGGKESRVPATVKGSSLVIGGIASELALRSTDGEIRVYNESLGGR